MVRPLFWNPMTHTAKFSAILGIGLVLTLAAAETAEARRGGSFGSRGARTYSAPRATPTAPNQTAPVQRSMTPAPKAAQTPGATTQTPGAAAAAAQPQRRGFLGGLGGLGGGLLAGLLAGGLIGALMGHGFGGLGAGMMNTLIQVAVIGLGVALVMAFLRRRKQGPAFASAERGPAFPNAFTAPNANVTPFPERNAAPQPSMFNAAVPLSGAAAPAPAAAPETVEIGLVQADRDAFERLLSDVQAAFGREDYGALRALTTPEIMSYLSEELSQNAVQGQRNEVSQTKLLQADIAEAWREGDTDYATAALRYESIDVMRDRQSNAVVKGDPNAPTQTTELWTFVRADGQPWKLSAIQEA